MACSSLRNPVYGPSGGAPPKAPDVPHSVWRPENGFVFSAGPAPRAGPQPAPSASQQSTEENSTQPPLVFGQPSSFGQAPSYGQVPAFGQAPSFGQTRSFERAPSFGQTPSFEQSPSFGNTFSLSRESAVFGQPASFGQAQCFAPRLPLLAQQQPVFGQAPPEALAHGQSSFGQRSFGRAIFVQPSFSQPIQPMFSFSQQSTSRLVHTLSGAGAVETQDSQADKKPEEAATETTHEAATEVTHEAAEAEIVPPETDLAFKMSKALFEKARNAAPGTPGSFWSYTLYRNTTASRNTGNVVSNAENRGDASDTESVPSETPATATAADTADGTKEEHERVKVHYCKSKDTTERVCSKYFADEPVLGFDLEWMADAAKREGPRRNVCLLQLSSPSRIGLFHLSLFPTRDLMTPALRKILESPDIIKAGVFIRGDATRLRNHLSVEMQGLMELSHLHRLVKYSKTGEHNLISKRLVSLAAQVQEHLKLPLFKGQDVRSSNWSRPLCVDQIQYSASDAYASVQLFAVLEKERQSLDPTPPRPAFAELNKPIQLANGAVSAAVADDADDTTDDAERPLQDGDEEKDEARRNGDSSQVQDSPTTSAKRKSVASASADKKDKRDKRDKNTARASRAPAVPQAFTDSRIAASHQWMDQYRESKPTAKAAPACLRAYHLWHSNVGLHPYMIAAMLRDPPLKTSTVEGYVLSAVQLEKLPYSIPRLKAEVLDNLPHKIRLSRYRSLAKVCGYDLTASDPAIS